MLPHLQRIRSGWTEESWTDTAAPTAYKGPVDATFYRKPGATGPDNGALHGDSGPVTWIDNEQRRRGRFVLLETRCAPDKPKFIQNVMVHNCALPDGMNADFLQVVAFQCDTVTTTEEGTTSRPEGGFTILPTARLATSQSMRFPPAVTARRSGGSR